MAKYLSILSLVFLLCLIAGWSFAQSVPSYGDVDTKIRRSVNRSIGTGDMYLERGEYLEALGRYQNALESEADNASLHFKIGVCLFYTAQDSLAKISFEKAYSLDKEVDKHIHYYLARSYHLAYEFSRAIGYYRMEIDSALKEGNSEYVGFFEKLVFECQSGIEIMEKVDGLSLVENIGPNVNSGDPEYAPIVGADGSRLYFTSIRAGVGTDDNEDIYYSEMSASLWQPAKNIGSPINTSGNDGVAGISKGGETLYLYADEGKGDLFYSGLQGGRWSEPLSVTGHVNSLSAETSITFSATGDTVFFISDREGSLGGSDIFYSYRQNSLWSEPESVGPVINTQYDESSVFFLGDTLYFASQGHNSMGGFDIFMTRLQSDRTWTPPLNLGFPVNSPYDDIFYSSTGDVAFFSSDRPGGMGQSDIYSVHKLAPVVVAVRPRPDSLVREPVKIWSVSNIMFALNRFRNEEAYLILDSLAAFLVAEPDAQILVTGYTDEEGDKGYNIDLSAKRADFVKQYLIGRGVDGGSVVTKGLGPEDPLSKNRDANGRFIWKSLKYNRRVEISVLTQGLNNQLVVRQISVPDEYRLPSVDYSPNRFTIWIKRYVEPVDPAIIGLEGVFEISSGDGHWDYYWGSFPTLESADEALVGIKSTFPEAFIIVRDSF